MPHASPAPYGPSAPPVFRLGAVAGVGNRRVEAVCDNPSPFSSKGWSQLSSTDRRAQAIGINHLVLEVGDIDEALEFYGASSSSSW